jgi:adenosylcobinamide amidohydrolase
MEVSSNYDNPNPATDLEATAAQLGIAEPFVGLLTAAWVRNAQAMVERSGQVAVAAVVTVGISLPTAAGITEAATLTPPPGTINIIVIADAVLPQSALINLVITVTEAKTLALVEAGIQAPHGGLASGTGTDAVVIASTQRGEVHDYAGPIAPVGALAGRAVRRAIQAALLARKATQQGST